MAKQKTDEIVPIICILTADIQNFYGERILTWLYIFIKAVLSLSSIQILKFVSNFLLNFSHFQCTCQLTKQWQSRRSRYFGDQIHHSRTFSIIIDNPRYHHDYYRQSYWRDWEEKFLIISQNDTAVNYRHFLIHFIYAIP